jgi:hypothetical protein
VVWLERAKIGKEMLSIFLNFSQLHQVLINVNRNKAIQRKGMEMATFLPIPVSWEILPPLLLA